MLWKMQVKSSDCFFFHFCLQIECKEMGRIGLRKHVFHFLVKIVKKSTYLWRDNHEDLLLGFNAFVAFENCNASLHNLFNKVLLRFNQLYLRLKYIHQIELFSIFIPKMTFYRTASQPYRFETYSFHIN